MKRTSLSLCLAATIAAALPTPAAAQAWTLSFAGGGQADIPLESGSLLLLQPDGRFTGRCVLSGGQCSGVSAPPPSGQLPTATLAGAATATTSAALQLSRTVTGAPELCVASAAPSAGVTGWNGAVGPASGTSSVSFTSNGTYALSMRCYNANGASSTAMHTVNVGGGGTTPPGCSLPPDPMIAPAGFTRYTMSWAQVFGHPNYPDFNVASPIGSYTVHRSVPGPSSTAMYITIPIVPLPNQLVTLRHYTAQYVFGAPPGHQAPWYGGDQSRAGLAFVSLSPCAGDVRAPNPSSPDQWLSKCRSSGIGEGPFLFAAGGTSSSVCRVNAGQTYWLTYMMADPANNPEFTNSCFFQSACETIVHVRTQPAE